MKILAIERQITKNDIEDKKAFLKEESGSVYKLYLENYLREIYFNERHNAVLILECTCIADAKKVLEQLPQVKNRIIDFEIMELLPYTGLSRLMTEDFG
jgi:hypothetical protein